MENEAVIDDEVIEEEESLRDTLSEAIEEHDPEHELVTPAEGEPVDKKPEPAPSDPSTATPSGKGADVPKPTAPVVAAPAQAPSTELKAPAQWKPAVREEWNKLPRAVQEEVLRRESDSMRLIGSVGPKIRMADELASHMAPFTGRLQENGVAPESFMNEVFTTVKQLAGGSPQERAEIVANIVQSYGVDLRTLDQVLTRRLQLPPEVMQQRNLAARQSYELQQYKQKETHQTALQAETAIAAFAADPKHEFIVDVRDLMADLIESGRATNLEDAYSAAVWANPDTRKILLQREAQSRAVGKNTRAAAARIASSSVRGAPSSTGTQMASSGSLREDLAAAFDEHSP